MSTILILNAGSSSLKFSLYDRMTLTPLFTGIVDTSPSIPPEKALKLALANFDQLGEEKFISAVGHRIVHGGMKYMHPVLITDDILLHLKELSPLAPLHQPYNLAMVEEMGKVLPHIPQVACFDTSFHRTQPRLSQLFPLPLSYEREGIIRYGFHGLSYEYISTVLETYAKEKAYQRVIVAHLGSGASLCAMKDLKSVATSMGFTALDGLMMGTRPGTIDPGIILHFLHEKGMTLDQVTDLLYHHSGLKGVSDFTHDMRDLLKSIDPKATLAIDLFCYIAAKHIAGLLPDLGGLDVLVFTAGIGEHCPQIRSKIISWLSALQIELDEKSNANDSSKISTPDSAVDVYVIPTDEELMIAQHVNRLLKAK